MPWDIVHEKSGWFVVKEGTRKKVNKKPHKTRKEAEAHRRALHHAEGLSNSDKKTRTARSGRKKQPQAGKGPSPLRPGQSGRLKVN